jgi:hypothetical protein
LNYGIRYGKVRTTRAERSEGAPKGKEKAMSQAGTIIRGEGEGERLWFAGGGLWTMKATAEETDGAFILVEDRMSLDPASHPSEPGRDFDRARGGDPSLR